MAKVFEYSFLGAQLLVLALALFSPFRFLSGSGCLRYCSSTLVSLLLFTTLTPGWCVV